MDNRVYTPDKITALGEDEILVFGNNSAGNADTAIARTARASFGAELNNPEGLQGETYSVVVAGVTFEELKSRISTLLDLIYEWDQTTFLITPLGVVEGGFPDKDIAPLFTDALDYYNIRLPRSYGEIIKKSLDK